MIDLHNHILPGVDDGAADLDESLAIARQFVSEGVVRIAATPHLDPENRRGPSTSRVRELVSEVQQATREAGIDLDIVGGQEVYLTPDVPELARNGMALGLGAGSSLLVELSLTSPIRPMYFEDVLFQLQVQGFQPVLAHPERYAFVQREPAAVEPLVERGVVLQLTAPSLEGRYGPWVRKTAKRLLQRGLYSLGASDRHHPGPERSLVRLKQAIARFTDEATAELMMVSNPQLVLEGRQPVRPTPAPIVQRSFLGRLFGTDD